MTWNISAAGLVWSPFFCVICFFSLSFFGSGATPREISLPQDSRQFFQSPLANIYQFLLSLQHQLHVNTFHVQTSEDAGLLSASSHLLRRKLEVSKQLNGWNEAAAKKKKKLRQHHERLSSSAASGAVSIDSYAVCLQTWNYGRSAHILLRDIIAFKKEGSSFSAAYTSPPTLKLASEAVNVLSMRDTRTRG